MASPNLLHLPELSARDIVRGDGVRDAVERIERNGTRYLITRYGAAVAGLVSVEDLVKLEQLNDGCTLDDIRTLAALATPDAGPDAGVRMSAIPAPAEAAQGERP